MKNLFLRSYRRAQAAGDPTPKVLLKLGHWHVMRGRSPGHVFTLGNFIDGFAQGNGSEAFLIGISTVSDVAGRGTLSDYPDYAPLTAAGAGYALTLVDLKALRGLAHGRKLPGLSSELSEWLFQYDAAVLIRDPSLPTYSAALRAKRRIF